MHKLYYQPKGFWFGDCMPFYQDGKFYLFHQRDTRNPIPLFGEPFGWSLACTTDFVHYEDFGEVITHGDDEDQDQFIFAGSLFFVNNIYYTIYTGYNHSYSNLNKASQVLMLAYSYDLINWTKTDQTLVTPQKGYDPTEWRDPFIFWNEDCQEYVMLMGARKLEGKRIRTGCTVFFTSTDFKNWIFKGDFWAPNLFYMHEMPDLFRIGDFWYLLTTEYSDKSKTVYRMSKTLDGPWIAPLDDAFDGRAYYAARSCSDGNKRYLFGWVPTKENQNDLAEWQWGGALIVHEIYQRIDFTLGTRLPEKVAQAFSQKKHLLSNSSTLDSQDGCAELRLAKDTGNLFLFRMNIIFSPDTKLFGLRFFEDEETGEAYEFTFVISERRVLFDKTPNLRYFHCMNKGLERPLSIAAECSHEIQIVVDDSIATLYVDGVALNTRMYNKVGRALTIFVADGKLEVLNAALETI